MILNQYNFKFKRYLILIVIIGVSIACQSKTSDLGDAEIAYSVDTVRIDSKGRLLDLKRSILISALDENSKSILLFNENDHSLDEINLDQLEFSGTYPLEVEGPNGTGKNVNSINLLKDGLLFIKSNVVSAIFNKEGKLLQRLDWRNSLDSSGQKYNDVPNTEFLLNSSGLRAFGLNYASGSNKVFLDVLWVQDSIIKRLDADPKGSYKSFILKSEDPQYFALINPYVYLGYEGGVITVGHEFSNEITLWDSDGKFLKTVEYDPNLTPKRVKPSGIVDYPTADLLFKDYQSYMEQVRFGPPVWDKVNQRYLRLSAIRKFSESREEGALVPKNTAEVYLSIFDSDFNLISEVYVPELDLESKKYFTKDGDLWVFQNLDDELGFLVLSF